MLLARWGPLLLPLAALAAAVGAALHAGLAGSEGHLVYALDDAYIHMALAKNFAREGIWGCTPFHFSSSSSSLLWTFLLGVAYRVSGVRDLTPLILNIGCAVATLVAAERILARFGASALLRCVALLALLVAFPMAGMVLMGMEHIVHLLLTIAFASAAVLALGRAAEVARPRRLETGLLCLMGALLAASRWEGLFLVGLACFGFLLRREWARAAAIALSAIAPVALFGALSVWRGGFFLPNSLVLKAAGESTSVLGGLLKPIGRADIDFFRNDPPLLFLALAGGIAGLTRWRARRSPWHPAVLLPLLLGAMILLHGHYVFSPTFWVYRYDAYLVGFGVFVAAVALVDLPTPRAGPAGLSAAALVAALTVVVADVREGVHPRVEIEGIRNTYLEHYQAAQFVARYYPDAVVLVNDLGAVTYGTEAQVLDLVGLGDVEPLQIMRSTGSYTSRDVLEWTAKHHPRIAIIQLGWGWIAPRVPREWIKVAEVEVPTHHQRIGFFAVDPQAAWVLRQSVDQHYGPLVRGLGYRIKLREAEKVDTLTVAADARTDR